MRRIAGCLLIMSAILFSCKGGKKTMLQGTWQGAKLENPAMDSFYANTQNYIDTFGRNNSAETNMALYGFANLDSVRIVMQKRNDSAKSMQMNAMMNTTFEFRADSIAYISFGGGSVMDTSKWHIEDNRLLVMEDMNEGAKGNIAKLPILGLTADELKLQFEEEGSHSIVTFKRIAK